LDFHLVTTEVHVPVSNYDNMQLKSKLKIIKDNAYIISKHSA